MTLMKRMSLIFKAKANKALDKAEDPREVLDYSYQKQLELLTNVRKGVADVATSSKRVELQINQLQQQADKLQGQAQQAINVNREDLAREALTRKSGLTQQIADWLQRQLAPAGVGVVIEAEHSCMSLRGVRAAGSRTVTSALHGVLRSDDRSRQEFFALVRPGR